MESVFYKEKTMPNASTDGTVKVSANHAKSTLASIESTRLVKLTSVNQTTPRWSSQHVKNEVKENNPSEKSYKKKQETVDMKTRSLYSGRSQDSPVKTDITSATHPKKHGKRSARPRGRNPTPWVPLEGLLNTGKELSKYMNGNSFDSKKMKPNQRGNTPCRSSERVRRLREKSGEDTKAKFLSIKTDIIERVNHIRRGKRSIRPRGNKPASWVPLDELQNFEKGLSSHGNDQEVGSKKMKYTRGATALCNASHDLIEHIDVAIMVDTSPAVKNSIGADAKKLTSVPIAATLDNVNEAFGSDTDATEHIGVTMPDTSFEFKDNNHADTNAVERVELLMAHAAAEAEASNAQSEIFVMQAGVPTTDASVDPKEVNSAIATALEKAAVQTADVVYPQQGRTNSADNNPEVSRVVPMLFNLGIGDGNLDLSSADSALASLYGESERDSCIVFAVKLLMDEMLLLLPKEAMKADEFLTKDER